MKNLKSICLFVLTGLSVALVQSGCKKDKEEAEGTGYMQMEMTDTPGAYLHVYVHVKSVEIHRSNTDTSASAASGTSGWTTLNTRDTIYDLLTLQNNITAVLCDSTLLPAGKVTQMRLILGANNSVVLNSGATHTLTIPSSANTGIKINLNTDIQKDKTTRVIIDFNADESINLLGDGSYQMKPVIKVKSIVMQ